MKSMIAVLALSGAAVASASGIQATSLSTGSASSVRIAGLRRLLQDPDGKGEAMAPMRPKDGEHAAHEAGEHDADSKLPVAADGEQPAKDGEHTEGPMPPNNGEEKGEGKPVMHADGESAEGPMPPKGGDKGDDGEKGDGQKGMGGGMGVDRGNPEMEELDRLFPGGGYGGYGEDGMEGPYGEDGMKRPMHGTPGPPEQMREQRKARKERRMRSGGAEGPMPPKDGMYGGTGDEKNPEEKPEMKEDGTMEEMGGEKSRDGMKGDDGMMEPPKDGGSAEGPMGPQDGEKPPKYGESAEGPMPPQDGEKPEGKPVEE